MGVAVRFSECALFHSHDTSDQVSVYIIQRKIGGFVFKSNSLKKKILNDTNCIPSWDKTQPFHVRLFKIP